MERLSGDMSALDKIKQLTEKLESRDKEFLKKFKEDFEEFEKEYDKIPWHILSEEDVEEPHLFFSEPKLCQVNENGEWEECKDGKVNLRKLTANACQVDGRRIIYEPVETSIDHIPIDRLVKEITDQAISEAQKGRSETSIYITYIDHRKLLYRQVHELLSVLYERLEKYVFDDTISLHVSWDYDYDSEETVTILSIGW